MAFFENAFFENAFFENAFLNRSSTAQAGEAAGVARFGAAARYGARWHRGAAHGAAYRVRALITTGGI